MSKLTDTDRLEWLLNSGKIPKSYNTYWGSTLWKIPGLPRINATTWRDAINDAIRNDAVTETNKQRKNKYQDRNRY
jgi:hypothetical protein